MSGCRDRRTNCGNEKEVDGVLRRDPLLDGSTRLALNFGAGDAASVSGLLSQSDGGGGGVVISVTELNRRGYFLRQLLKGLAPGLLSTGEDIAADWWMTFSDRTGDLAPSSTDRPPPARHRSALSLRGRKGDRLRGRFRLDLRLGSERDECC